MDSPSRVPLPTDVLHYIISTILPLHLNRIPLTRTLLSLCRVSHLFLEISQPVLYSTPFLSFDPPDTTPPGTTFERITKLVETLKEKKDVRIRVKNLDSLGQWSVRCLSEGIPNRKQVSKTMLELIKIVTMEKNNQLKILSFPFLTMSDKDEFLKVLSSPPPSSKSGDDNDDESISVIEEILFGEGGAYEPSNDPWVINLDQTVREEWGVAKFTMKDFKRLRDRWKNLKRFRLMAKLKVEDPLEEDDELLGDVGVSLLQDGKEEQEEEEKFEFELEGFELNLLKNSKLSFNYLDRFLRRSIETLTTLILKEHQFSNPSTLYHFLTVYGKNLNTLKTCSSNPWDDNYKLLETISQSCGNLRVLKIGSSCRKVLLPTITLLAQSDLGRNVEYLELSNCYSLTLYPPLLLLPRTKTKEDRTKLSLEAKLEETSPEILVEELARALFKFDKLKFLIVGPQHSSIEDGYEQERNVGRYFRDLDGFREEEETETEEERGTRVIQSEVSFWRWKVELLGRSK